MTTHNRSHDPIEQPEEDLRCIICGKVFDRCRCDEDDDNDLYDHESE